jgi:hypothetical protein
MKPPPEGSYLIVSQSGRDATISIPNPIKVSQFGSGLFLLAWLGGWAVGEYFVLTELISGSGPTGVKAFMLFWLAGWTIGGVFAMAQAYRIFAPPKPETISLDAGGITHNTGSRPAAKWRGLSWGALTGQGYETRIDRRMLPTLQLREMASHNRLTVDVGANRIELAPAATDVEREWLLEVIRERYGTEAATAKV